MLTARAGDLTQVLTVLTSAFYYWGIPPSHHPLHCGDGGGIPPSLALWGWWRYPTIPYTVGMRVTEVSHHPLHCGDGGGIPPSLTLWGWWRYPTIPCTVGMVEVSHHPLHCGDGGGITPSLTLWGWWRYPTIPYTVGMRVEGHITGWVPNKTKYKMKVVRSKWSSQWQEVRFLLIESLSQNRSWLLITSDFSQCISQKLLAQISPVNTSYAS